MTGHRSSGTLNVSTLDAFAAKWLVPRLFRFRRAHGGIDVRLSTSERLADFVTDGIEIGIRYGRGRYPGLKAELLLEEDISPVCSPKLLEGPLPLSAPADLIHHTLIHDDFHVDWAMWLKTAGVEGVDASGPGVSFVRARGSGSSTGRRRGAGSKSARGR